MFQYFARSLCQDGAEFRVVEQRRATCAMVSQKHDTGSTQVIAEQRGISAAGHWCKPLPRKPKATVVQAFTHK